MQHSKEYDKYMSSNKWKEKRVKRLKLDNNCCVMCGRPNNGKDGKEVLQVHHITYKHLGNEPLEDLVSLCPSCHKKIHKYYNRARNEPVAANN